MDYIKGVIEALKMDTKSKSIGFFVGLIILLLKPFSKELNMTYFYNRFTWIVVLITIFFAVSIAVDFVEAKYNKREKDKKNAKRKNAELQKQQRFEYYVLGLKGRKRRIVRDMYRNYHHRDYVSVNDSDALDLLLHNVIIPTKNSKRVDIYGKEREYNELQELFILAPRVVQIIDKNKEKFNL